MPIREAALGTLWAIARIRLMAWPPDKVLSLYRVRRGGLQEVCRSNAQRKAPCPKRNTREKNPSS
jgi:hypothetical protein